MHSAAVNSQAGTTATETDRLISALQPLIKGPPDPRSAAVRENARLAVEHDPVRIAHERWLVSEEHRQSIAWIRALRLAGPSLDVFEALMRGDKVPRSRLDPLWAKAYGL